jgi:hypothetical protein
MAAMIFLSRSVSMGRFKTRGRKVKRDGTPAALFGEEPADIGFGRRTDARSVIRPVTRRAGVTSKANWPPGWRPAAPAPAPGGRRPGPGRSAPRRAARSSMGFREPRRAGSSRKVEGQGHVERNPVVPRRQGLEVGADLVGHVAGVGGAVGAHDHHIHQAVLHQVAAGVVGDHRVGTPAGPVPRPSAASPG